MDESTRRFYEDLSSAVKQLINPNAVRIDVFRSTTKPAPTDQFESVDPELAAIRHCGKTPLDW